MSELTVPDPAPEIVISLPKRGKIRITSAEEADMLIAAAAHAKSMYLAAVAVPSPAAPKPQGEHPYPAAPGGEMSRCESVSPSAGTRCIRVSPHPDWQAHTDAAGREWGDPEPAGLLSTCATVTVHGACARLAGHSMPHRDRNGREWDDAPAPDDVYVLTPAGAAALDDDETRTPCDSMEFGNSPPTMVDGQCRCIICARCGHHTGNSHQGHYWAACAVTGGLRDFHFCCPDPAFGCSLEAASEPHHWEPGETPCHDQDEDGPELWLCTAQQGHGGPEHIAYGDDGDGFSEVRRWPVTPLAPHFVKAGGGPRCRVMITAEPAASGEWTCTAQAGHAGPDHIAHDGSGREVHRWPVTDPVAVVADAIANGTKVILDEDEAAAVAAAVADAKPRNEAGDCIAATGAGDKGLFCWRMRHDDPWHYDQVDGLAWRLDGPDGQVIVRKPVRDPRAEDGTRLAPEAGRS